MSDYISREALIGKAEKHYCAPCKGQGGDLGGDWCRSCVINSVLEKVRGIPAADVAPVKHWIPCSKRLPEIGVTVLTLDKYKHVASRTRKSYVNGTPYFYPDGLEPGRHITHWMPLPEMPEKEGT